MNDLDELVKQLETYGAMSNKAADNVMSKYRSKAEGKYKNVEKRLNNMLIAAEPFKYIGDLEEANAMDKYSHKIYETINDTVKSINKPKKFTQRKLEKIITDLRDTISNQDQQLIKYVKLLKGKKFEKKLKPLSKSIVKLNDDLVSLERYWQEEYTPNSEIEDTSNFIEDLISDLNHFTSLYREIASKEDQINEKNSEIIQINRDIENIISHPVKSEYDETTQDFSEFQKHLENEFSNIRKALRKYENAVSKQKDKPDLTLLKEVMKDLAICLANQGSFQGVANLLSRINNELENSNLQLKKDKRDAIRADIEQLLEGKLEKDWKIAREKNQKKIDLEQKLKELDLEDKENKLRMSLNAAKRDRNRLIERDFRDLQKLTEEISKSGEELKSKLLEISNDIREFEVNLPELPAWAILIE